MYMCKLVYKFTGIQLHTFTYMYMHPRGVSPCDSKLSDVPVTHPDLRNSKLLRTDSRRGGRSARTGRTGCSRHGRSRRRRPLSGTRTSQPRTRRHPGSSRYGTWSSRATAGPCAGPGSHTSRRSARTSAAPRASNSSRRCKLR